MKKGKAQELTQAELQIMQVVWAKGRVFVKDVLAEMPEPKPAYNTVSTFIRILEKKGFIGHTAYGKSYEYYPLIPKEEYTGTFMTGVLNNFFGGSLSRLVSYFSDKKAISLEEADEILKMLEK